MIMRIFSVCVCLGLFSTNPSDAQSSAKPDADRSSGQQARRLTVDAFAMEAYFSWDGRRIIFQGRDIGKPGPLQVFLLDYRPDQEPAPKPVQVTDGPSSHECTFFSRDGRHIVYATSGRKVSDEEKADFGGYPYHYDLTKDVWIARIEGDRIVARRRITNNSDYEAETSFSPLVRNLPDRADGIYLLYTSSRSGSLDLWIQRVFDPQGNEVLDRAIQLTNTPTQQEGGAFFLSDHEIVYRTWEFDPADPKTEQMERGRVNYRPMQIHVLDLATGKDTTVTSGNARHWAPFPHPFERKIVFAKRDFSLADHDFDIHVVDLETGKQERITSDRGFEGYPVFHPSGKVIMYSCFDPRTHDFSLWTVPYPPKRGDDR